MGASSARRRKVYLEYGIASGATLPAQLSLSPQLEQPLASRVINVHIPQKQHKHTSYTDMPAHKRMHACTSMLVQLPYRHIHLPKQNVIRMFMPAQMWATHPGRGLPKWRCKGAERLVSIRDTCGPSWQPHNRLCHFILDIMDYFLTPVALPGSRTIDSAISFWTLWTIFGLAKTSNKPISLSTWLAVNP